MKSKHDGGVVVGPRGPIAPTFGVTQDDCWAEGWHYVSDKLGGSWANKHWKKWEQSIHAASAEGYTKQKDRLTTSDCGLWR